MRNIYLNFACVKFDHQESNYTNSKNLKKIKCKDLHFPKDNDICLYMLYNCLIIHKYDMPDHDQSYRSSFRLISHTVI